MSTTLDQAAGPALGAPAVASPRARIDSVDLLRGIVMVVMLLDHTRDFAHYHAMHFDPTDLSRTYPALFFTRWVTHFCAPIFVFLAGVGAHLQLARGKSKRDLSWFLVTRGLWLIVLEFTVVRLVVAFNLDYGAFPGFIQVIFAVGVSMIVLAGLIHLPLRAVAGIGLAIVVLHNLLDGIQVPQGPGAPAPGVLESIWMVLHQPGLIFPGGAPVFVLYPVLAWIGVMALGYSLGSVYRWEAERRQRFLLRAGLATTAAFIAIRAVNVYGDPRPWSGQESPVFTLLSFLNTTKYPPSLLFLLMTLGPALLALAWFERTKRGPVGRALVTFGRVPLFFYVLQWIAAHLLPIGAGVIAGQTVAYQFLDPMTRFTNPPPDVGFGLEITYLLWILGVVLLYPLCRWFAAVKRRRSDWWLSYL